MTDNQKIYEQLKEKYSLEELADAVMFSEKIDAAAEKEFIKLRLQKRANRTEQEQMLSALLSIKYRMKTAIKQIEWKSEYSFGTFLKSYLKAVGRTQKILAEEIAIHPSRLNRIIKGKERIGKSIAYRLERHSGDIIPAIYWWKLMQKEIEQEIMTEQEMRISEHQQVRKVAYTT